MVKGLEDERGSKKFEDINIRTSRKSYLYYYFMLLVIGGIIIFIYFNENLSINLYAGIVAGVFVFGIIKFTEIHRLYKLYTITSSELIITEGIVIKKMQRYKLQSFSDASLTQTVIQRILGIGNIQMLQFDLGVEIKNINKPEELLRKITERL